MNHPSRAESSTHEGYLVFYVIDRYVKVTVEEAPDAGKQVGVSVQQGRFDLPGMRRPSSRYHVHEPAVHRCAIFLELTTRQYEQGPAAAYEKTTDAELNRSIDAFGPIPQLRLSKCRKGLRGHDCPVVVVLFAWCQTANLLV